MSENVGGRAADYLAGEAELEFEELVRRRPDEAGRSLARTNAQLAELGVRFSQTALPISLKPHFVTQPVHARWVRATEQLFEILEAVMPILLQSDELLTLLGFTDDAVELLRIDPGYSKCLVNSRPDVMVPDGQLKVIEINTDSPAMVAFTDTVQSVLASMFPLADLIASRGLVMPDRTKGFLDGIIAAYRAQGGTKVNPTIAIIDWTGVSTHAEQEMLARRFTDEGYPSFTCDPGECSMRRGRLIARGVEVDIVQRRILFPDFLRREDELEALLEAYRTRAAVFANPLRSYLVGNKGFLAVLRHPLITPHLSAEQRQVIEDVVPETVLLDEAGRLRLRNEDPQGWVVKAAFGYGGKEVLVGRSARTSEWQRTVSNTEAVYSIAQRVVPRTPYRIVSLEGGKLSLPMVNMVWSPWVFSGKYAGGTARFGPGEIVSITQRGLLTATIAV
jgi:hypothetical protein